MSGRGLGAVGLALLLTGCVKGLGDPCELHSDCAPGLSCGQGKCQACGDGATCLGVDLVVKGCDPAMAPIDDLVSVMRVTVTGDGLTPKVSTSEQGSSTVQIPDIPFGTNRRIMVEALESADAAVPRARGVSAPFDLSAETPPEAVVVYLRKTNAFTRVSGIAEQEKCAELVEPRAGHTATRLLDGRVLLAGGFSFTDEGQQTFLKTAELYDPKSGTFSPLSSTLQLPRAGHTATLLPDGRVLLTGGYTLINQNQLQVTPTAELYDPKSGTFSFLLMGTARVRHSASLLSGGVVVLAGGVSEPDGTPLQSIEIFDPKAPLAQAFRSVDATLSSRRADHAAVVIEKDVVLVIGGTNGSGPLDTVEAFAWSPGGTLVPQEGTSWQLGTGREEPLAIPVNAGDKQGVLVLGAPATGGMNVNEAFDWIAVSEGEPGRNASPLPTYRFDACAAAFPGGVLVAGGRRQGASDTEFLYSADVMMVNPDGALATVKPENNMYGKRRHLTCTALDDGTVLVAGGEEYVDARRRASGIAEIFQPR